MDDDSHIGFGLIVAKQTIEAFGGKIDFSSEPGVGTTFVFTFDLELPGEIELEYNEYKQKRPQFKMKDEVDPSPRFGDTGSHNGNSIDLLNATSHRENEIQINIEDHDIDKNCAKSTTFPAR